MTQLRLTLVGMTRSLSTIFVCQNCGASFPKWQGKCFSCGEFGGLVESVLETAARKPSKGQERGPFRLSELASTQLSRFGTGISEFDRVLGGGLVPGSVVLLGGEPGVGKSTLLLQIAAAIGSREQTGGSSEKNLPQKPKVGPGQKTTLLYISGEESPEQIKLRADRLSIRSDYIQVLAAIDVDSVLSQLGTARTEALNKRGGSKIQKKSQSSSRESRLDFVPSFVQLLMIDSVQTMVTSDLTSPAGSISQVQECARRLIAFAKKNQTPLILTSHVTKAGAIAGPKTLEHLVDTVLYFEGDQRSNYRFLRGTKNRFGDTHELGIFRMSGRGLEQIDNLSHEVFEQRREGVAGSVFTITLEGTRSLLLEVQALVSRTPFGLPRRTVNGIDYNRLLMLLAVLQKRGGFSFAQHDVFVNITGGLKAFEPAVDLPICLALASCLKDKPVAKELVAIGEVGLLGEIKRVPQLERRIKEAKRLGFKEILSFQEVGLLKDALSRALR